MLRAEAARVRRMPPENLRAHHYYLRAVGMMGDAFTNPEGGALEEARALLARAIELDHTYAPALALAGYYEAKASIFGRHTDSEAGDKLALELAERAVRADPADPLGLGAYVSVCATPLGDPTPAAAF